MNTDLRGFFVRWTVFTLGFGPLLLWCGCVFLALIGQHRDLFGYVSSGGALLYAAALGMQVVRDTWERRCGGPAHRRRAPVESNADFLLEYSAPLVVLVLSLTTYMALLEVGPKGAVIGMQAVILTLSLGHNCAYCLRNEAQRLAGVVVEQAPGVTT